MAKPGMQSCNDAFEDLKSRGFKGMIDAADVRLAIIRTIGASDNCIVKYMKLLCLLGFIRLMPNGQYEMKG